MNRLIAPALALGLSTAILPGCAEEPTFVQKAAITGYYRGEDAQIVEDHWVLHTEEYDQPFGNVRNVRTYQVQDGCHEEWDTFGVSFDDPKCWGTWCSSSDETYCTPTMEDRFDYEQLEEILIEDCPAPVVPLEFKPEEVVRDAACMAQRKDGQRFNITPKFFVWLRTNLPQKQGEESSTKPPKSFIQNIELTAEQWQELDPQNKSITVSVQGNEIVDFNLAS